MLSSQVILAKEPTVTEYDLGVIARFTRTPIGSKDDLAFEATLNALAEKTDDTKRVTLAVSCYKRKHLSVFEFADFIFCVDCPIFVARQLMRHRNGTFMEKSLRALAPAFRSPYTTDYPEYAAHYEEACNLYDKLVKSGERKEVARAVLPLCTPTAFLWKINLRSLLNVFDQRLNLCAQKETRETVQQMYDIAFKYFPNILREWKLEHERL